MAGEIERLISNLESMDGPGQDVDEARAELSALRAENARMREALLRLVKATDVVYLDDEATDADDVMELETAMRKARAALGGRDA